MSEALKNKIASYEVALQAFLEWSAVNNRIKSTESMVRNNLNLARRELRAFELELQEDIV